MLSPQRLFLEWMPNVLIKPTESFFLLTSDELLPCFAEHLIFKKAEKIMQGMISGFLSNQQKIGQRYEVIGARRRNP